jgi:hypothetical protein
LGKNWIQPKQEITTDTDIKTIKVVLGGAGLNEANDKSSVFLS